MFAELQRAEIIDWWEGERFRVTEECRMARAGALGRIDEGIAALGMKECLLPRSAARRSIERRLESDVNMLRKRLARTFSESMQASYTRVQALECYDGPGHVELGVVAASGAVALGSLGLAASATSLATTTTIATLFVASVTTFSWPVFLGLGTVALSLAVASPTAMLKASSLARRRFRNHLLRTLDSAIMAEDGSAPKGSTLRLYLDQIDRAARTRLESFG